MGISEQSQMDSGIEFQTVEAAVKKVLSPQVRSLVLQGLVELPRL